MHRSILVTLLLTLGVISSAYTGEPKEIHPCYDVADCKVETSKKAFSACIKKNAEAANHIAECTEFRQDKSAYLKKVGLSSVDELFN